MGLLEIRFLMCHQSGASNFLHCLATGLNNCLVDPKSRPIVITGKLNPERNFRVLKITINNGSPNIRAGQFSADWHQDPALLNYVLKNFDILEVSMSTPQSKRGGFLVVTGRAGPAAIIWE